MIVNVGWEKMRQGCLCASTKEGALGLSIVKAGGQQVGCSFEAVCGSVKEVVGKSLASYWKAEDTGAINELWVGVAV